MEPIEWGKGYPFVPMSSLFYPLFIFMQPPLGDSPLDTHKQLLYESVKCEVFFFIHVKSSIAYDYDFYQFPTNTCSWPNMLQERFQNKPICDAIKQNESEVKNFCFYLFHIFY